MKFSFFSTKKSSFHIFPIRLLRPNYYVNTLRHRSNFILMATKFNDMHDSLQKYKELSTCSSVQNMF